MKKLLFSLIILSVFKVSAQNSFPTAASTTVVVGPTNILDVNGATRLRLAVEMSHSQFFAINANNTLATPSVFNPRVAGFSSSFIQNNTTGTFTFNMGNLASSATTVAVGWRPAYTILNNLNFGIGVIAPAERLEIGGNMRFPSGGNHIVSSSGFTSFGETFSTSDAFVGSMVKSNVGTAEFVKTATGLGSLITMQANDGIRFQTNLAGASGTPITTALRNAGEVMRITHSGFVGIGTTAPANKLHIVGAAGTSGLRFGNLTSATATSLTNNKVLSVNASGDVILVPDVMVDSTFRKTISVEGVTGIGTAQKMSILSNGNVGIGVAAPAAKLDITTGTAGNSGLKLSNLPNTTANTFLTTNATGNVVLATATGGTATPVDSTLRKVIGVEGELTGYNSLNQKIRIMTNGNVGVGLTGPTSLLSVGRNQTAPTSISVSNLGTIGANTIMQFLLSEDGSSTHGFLRRYRDGTGLTEVGFTDNLAFSTGVSSTKAERMRIMADGKIGIGTNAPVSQFQVVAPINNTFGTASFRTSGGSKNPALWINNDETTGVSSIDFTGTTGYSGRIKVGSLDVMSFSNLGNVGIGTINPTVKLDVAGTVKTTELKTHVTTGNSAVLSFSTNGGTSETGFVGIAGAATNLVNTSNAGEMVIRNAGSILISADGGSNTNLKIASNGNVGIGSLTPAAKLDITAAAGTSGLKLSTLTNILPNKFLTTDATGNVILATGGSSAPLDSLSSWLKGQYGKVIRSTKFMYTGSPYPANQLGDSISTSMGVNVNTIAGGNFNGRKEMIIPNTYRITQVNSAGTDFLNGVMGFNNGNVGIGTISPIAKFDVSGGGTRLNGGYGDNWFPYSDGNNYLRANNHIFANSSAVERVRITGDGNVGIGTTTPIFKLDVNGSAQIKNIWKFDPNGVFYWGSNYGNGILTWDTGYASIQGQTGNELRVGVNGASKALVVKTTGKVIINDAVDDGVSELQVGGTIKQSAVTSSLLKADATGRIVAANATDINSIVGLGNAIQNQNLSAQVGNFWINGSGRVGSFRTSAMIETPTNTDFTHNAYYSGGWKYRANGFAMDTYQDGSGSYQVLMASNGVADTPITFSPAFTIQNAGNVGIGTNSPSVKFEVNSSLNDVAIFKGIAGVAGIKLNNDVNKGLTSFVYKSDYASGSTFSVGPNGSGILQEANGPLAIGTYGVAQPLIFGTNSTEKMRLTSSGNLGIGTNSPTEKFVVETGINKRVLFSNASSAISDFSTGGSAMIFSRPNDGSNGLTGIFTYNTALGDHNLALASRSDISFATGGNSLYSNAIDRLRIKENGNVGIGTATPGSKLDVVGSGLVRSRIFSSDNQANLTLTGQFGQIENSNSEFFITNNSPTGSLIFRAGSTVERMRINATGQVVIGTTLTSPLNAEYKLAVGGSMIAEKVKVRKQSAGWPDFVFKKDYKLMTLPEIEAFVNKNSHLPEIPSASEIEKDGQDLGEMNRLLLKKVEELTLHLIEQNKKLTEVVKTSEQQQKEIEILKKKN
jgi:hypothetical protein